MVEKNSVFQLVNQLSPGEKRRFSIFLNSSYFNQESRMDVLFKLLTQRTPPTREECWEELEGNVPYDDDRMRQWLTRLFALSKRFITLRSFESNPRQHLPVWLRELHERKIDGIFKKEMRAASKSIEDNPRRNGEYFWARFQMEYTLELSRVFDKTRAGRLTGINEMRMFLNAHYQFTQAHFDCLEWSVKNTSGNYTPSKISVEPNGEWISVNLFRELAQLLNRPSIDGWDLLFKKLVENPDILANDERYDLYSGLHNKLIKTLSNHNMQEIIQKLYTLYQFGLKQKIILEGDKIPASYFKNIVEAGLMINRENEVAEFIQTYQSRLEKIFITPITAFTTARLHFHRKEFAKALTLLNSTDFSDLFLMLNARLLKLKAWYELKEALLLESGLKSFAQYLRDTDKVPQDTRKRYSNRLKYLRKMYENPKPAKLQALKKEILEKERPFDANWFLEKLDELLTKPYR